MGIVELIAVPYGDRGHCEIPIGDDVRCGKESRYIWVRDGIGVKSNLVYVCQEHVNTAETLEYVSQRLQWKEK